MIICAAIKDIRTGDVFCDVRHGDIYNQLHAANHRIPRDKVIIEDSVTMNEFQSKYEIIKVEGKIYTVKERAK